MAVGTGMLQKTIRSFISSLEELGYYSDTDRALQLNFVCPVIKDKFVV